MSALLCVSFHFQAEKFQGSSGGGSHSASRPWAHCVVFPHCRKAVCAVLGLSPAAHTILILARPLREWGWGGVEGTVEGSMDWRISGACS